MKLYTEEQVMKFINDNFEEGCSELVGLTPIELPTDADIHKQATNHSNLYDEFRAGATWVLNRIYGSVK